MLEHYHGAVIFTSNRVSAFSTAFTSRIHVSIRFDDLDWSSRRRVWENFIDMELKGQEVAGLSKLFDHLDQLAAHEMNGRQIRNAFNIARRLARSQSKTIGLEHLKQAITAATDFHQ